MRTTEAQTRGSPSEQVEREHAFLLGRLIDRETLARADREACASGVAPHRVLLARGWVGADRYVEALSGHLSRALPFGPRAPVSTVLLDATTDRPAELGPRIAAERAAGRAVMLVSPAAAECGDLPVSRAQRAEEAAGGFLNRHPDYSAGAPVWLWQLVTGLTAITVAGAGLVAVPATAQPALAALIAVPFLFVVVLRVLALAMVVGGGVRQQRLPRPMPDTELPVYTILVPMLREADVIADFIAAVRALDYPPAKLDVILILESADIETQLAAAALDLPGFVRVVVVPDTAPRTKPKALNFGLQFARGQYVAVYDAEDVPDRDQLKRALAMLAAPGAELACVQAQLSTYNPRANWLTRGIMAQTPVGAMPLAFASLWEDGLRVDRCLLRLWSDFHHDYSGPGLWPGILCDSGGDACCIQRHCQENGSWAHL